MKIFDLINNDSLPAGSIEIEAWLVIIEGKLFLLNEELESDYRLTERIEISNSEIIFAVREQILPLGGGESFVFHQAIASGKLEKGDFIFLHVDNLLIRERGNSVFKKIDISNSAIENGKIKYPKLMTPMRGDDWMDQI